MRFRVVPILLAVLAALVPVAWSATGPDVGRVASTQPAAVKSPDLWATINVCDTLTNPDTVGIRGSMPGLPNVSTLWMRFKVQYLATQTDGKWHDVTDNADSGWKQVGRLKRKVVEAGQNFMFQPPATGGAHRLRGSVTFKWTRHGHVVLKVHEVTEAGHRSTAGADPEGYSAAVCDIT
ncbi:MAG: hypothetical protein QOE86_3737 [Solirubrobacteraceae bacterium]|jgi:hypothetical protein|nr:hypothetical protein [Solirubrobacteraceae bacterium]